MFLIYLSIASLSVVSVCLSVPDLNVSAFDSCTPRLIQNSLKGQWTWASVQDGSNTWVISYKHLYLCVCNLIWVICHMLASLPVVYNGDKMVEGMRPVLAFMRGRGWNADYYLNEKQASDTLAFEALVEEKLHPAIVRNVGCTNSVEMGRWVCVCPWIYRILLNDMYMWHTLGWGRSVSMPLTCVMSMVLLHGSEMAILDISESESPEPEWDKPQRHYRQSQNQCWLMVEFEE